MRRSDEEEAVILSLDGDCAVVLMRDGSFRRIRVREGAQVGELCSVASREHRYARALRNLGNSGRRWRTTGLAAVVACCVLIGGLMVGAISHRSDYALVSLDANGQVSFAVDAQMRVVSAHGLNSEGQKVLSAVPVKGLPLTSAVDEVVSKLAQTQALPRNDSIVVTTASVAQSADVHAVDEEVISAIHTALGKRDPGNVYHMDVPKSVWAQAQAAHVSPGQYATYLLAQQVGVPVKLIDLNSANLQTVLAEAHDLHTALSGFNTGDYQQVASIVESAVGPSTLNSTQQYQYNG